MKYKYLLVAFALSLCANANAEWFMRGTHNGWAAAQMEAAGSNTVQLKGVVFTTAGSFKFDRYGDWKESYGVGGRGGSNIPVAAGTWDIKFFINSKTWSVTTAPTLVNYHVRGTHNNWQEGDLLNRIGTSDSYELCVNFVSGDANGGPRFKIDPNGEWGDGIPDNDLSVNAGWVKISFNSVSKVISTQQNLGVFCNTASSSLASSSTAATSSSLAASSKSSLPASSLASSKSSVASSSSTVNSSVKSSSSLVVVSSSVKSSAASSSAVASSAPASIYHVRGTFNGWAEGSLMSRIGTTSSYEYCVNFVAGDAAGSPRFKIDPNGAWGDGIPSTDYVVNAGWVKITFNSSTKAIAVQQNLPANCAASTSSSIASSTAQSSLSSAVASSVAGSIYHLRGTFNSWVEGTLMTRVGTTSSYEYCVNFLGGDGNGGPRFKIDPNGGWGSDSIPAADFVVTPGWVKILFNSATKAISVQQNLAPNCTVAVSSSSLASSSLSVISSSSLLASSSITVISSSSAVMSSSAAVVSSSTVAVSSSAAQSSLPPLSRVSGITVDSANNRALVADEHGIIAINLTTATGVKFFDASKVQVAPYGGAVDLPNNRVLVGAPLRATLFSIDLTSGAHSSLAVHDDLFNSYSLAIDAANNRALVTTIYDCLIAVNLSSGQVSRISEGRMPQFSDSVRGVVVDSTNNRALVLDYAALVAVNLTTGERSLISGADFPNSDNSIEGGGFNAIALDSARNRALVMHHDSGRLIAVDLTTGLRTLLVSGLQDTTAITIDAANNRALITSMVESQVEGVLAINLTTLAKTVFYK